MKRIDGGPVRIGTVLLAAGLVIWGCSGGRVTAAEEQNLITNGDMEQGNPPADWRGGGATLSAVPDCPFGKQSLKILTEINLGRALHTFPVEPDTTYRWTFWFKCPPGSSFYAYIGVDGRPGNACAIDGSGDVWTRKSVEFKTPDAEVATVGTMGICTWPGKDGILIDRVSVTEIIPGEDPPEAEAPTNVLRAKRTLSREEVLKRWQALFPTRQYLCWEKSPWENLSRLNTPPDSVKECRNLRVAMGENEYESASFVLTNLSEEELAFEVSTEGSGVPVTLREAVWVTSYGGKEVNDALPLLEGNVRVPSGESREIWMTFHSKGVEAGNYRMDVKVKPEGSPAFSIQLRVKVYPVSLPEDKPIYTLYWDYLTPFWGNRPDLHRAFVEDMKRHYVNVGVGHPGTIEIKFDPDGEVKKDFPRLDPTLDCYRLLDTKMVILFWNTEQYLEQTPDTFKGEWKFLSDEWKVHFEAWLTNLAAHLKEKGWGNDEFAMYPYDEKLGTEVYEVVKLIKEIDPKIQVYVNSVGTLQEVKNISPYVDIWGPSIHSFLPNYSTNVEEKKVIVELLKEKGRFFWTYANPQGGGHPKESSPYGDYRLAVWRAWNLGARGFGYWIYKYKTHWNSYKHGDGNNWAVVYLADAEDAPPGISKKEPVIAGKRWEATREGVEDYVYLYMLREAVEKAGREADNRVLQQGRELLAERPGKVLGDVYDQGLADEAKEEVLEMLARIKPRDP